MNFHAISDLTDYLLQEYLDAAEAKNPGIKQRTVDKSNREMEDALRPHYVLPLVSDPVPETLCRISSVFSAYRILGAITSLVSSEAGSNNEFLFLQREYKRAEKDWNLLREGKLKIGLEKLGEEKTGGGGGLKISSPEKVYTDEFLGQM